MNITSDAYFASVIVVPYAKSLDCLMMALNCNRLTLGSHKMAAILKAISNLFSCIKIVVFSFKFH